MQANLLLRGGRVVGHPAGTDILVRDGTIAAIGPALPAEAAEIVDAAQTIVMPGFVDTHRHLWQTSIRGVAADWSLVDYIRQIRLGYATAFRPEDVYISTLVGALEAIEAGITTLADFCHIIRSPEHADAARQALVDSGMRARMYYGFYDIPDAKPFFQSHPERLAHARQFRRAFGGAHGLLSMGLALTEFNLLPIADTEAEVALGRELDLDITMHMGTLSTPDGVTRLQAVGLLGPRMLHVHCNALYGCGAAAHLGERRCLVDHAGNRDADGHGLPDHQPCPGRRAGANLRHRHRVRLLGRHGVPNAAGPAKRPAPSTTKRCWTRM